MAQCPSRATGRLRRAGACAALLLPALVVHADSHAAGRADPVRFQCMGRNQFSGAANVPVEKQDETGTWTYAVFLVDPVKGTPVIVYGPGYRALDPLMQSFIRRHECQHANGVRDEIAANCAALVQMREQGLTPMQEAHLERWHLAKGRLDPQYGGSGAAFWERTVRCAATAR